MVTTPHTSLDVIDSEILARELLTAIHASILVAFEDS
jgi:hypothetical protein